MSRGARALRLLLTLSVLNSLTACQPDSVPVAGLASGCDGDPLKMTDFAGILTAPITQVRPVSGDVQSCEFATASFPAITVSLRPGLGVSTVDAWAAGRMPLMADPLAGVGEKAVWQSSLHEVIAQKRDLLCDIQAHGGPEDFAVKDAALPLALGALCNRVFDGSAVHS